MDNQFEKGTLEYFKEIAKTFPVSVIELFDRYHNYTKDLLYRDEALGKKAHATKLYNRFYNECIKLGLSVDYISAILTNSKSSWE